MTNKNSRKARGRCSKRKRGANVNRSLASNAVDSESEKNKSSPSDPDEFEIRVPSNALMPARKMGDPPSPAVCLPVKDEPVDMDTGETSLDSDLRSSDNVPLNSQKGVAEHEVEQVSCSSSETNCVLGTKIKEEPIDPAYDFALKASERNDGGLDADERVRKKIKVERRDSDVRASDQWKEVVANQNDDGTSVPHSFTDDSNSADTVLNFPVQDEQNTVFPPGLVKVKQEPNSVAEDGRNKSEKDGRVHVKKEPVDNSAGPTMVINGSDVSDSSSVHEIWTNVPVKSESVVTVNIPQSSVPLKCTSITDTRGTESIGSLETSGEKISSVDRRPCSNSSSPTSSRSGQLEKPNIATLAGWHTRTVSSKPNSKLTPSNVTVGCLKKRLCIDFDLSDVREALKYISKRTISKPNNGSHSHEGGCMPEDGNVISELRIIENKIEDFISSIRCGKEPENIVVGPVESDYLQQESMDVDRPASIKIPSLTPTSSDTLSEKVTSNSKSLFTSAIKVNSSGAKASPFSVNVLSPSEPSATVDQMSNEKLKEIISMLPNEHALSANLPFCSPCKNITSVKIPSIAASAKQSVDNNNSPCGSSSDHSRNSVMNRPIRNFRVNCTDLNREHNFISTSSIGNEPTNASYTAKTKPVRKQTINTVPSITMDNRSNNFEQTFIPTSHISFVPSVQVSRNQALSLVPTPGSPRNRLVSRATEIYRSNNYLQDSKTTARAESHLFSLDSPLNPNTSRQVANATGSTNIPNVHSSLRGKKGSSPPNVQLSDKSRAKSTVSCSGEKRKITAEEYIKRNKIYRVDNGNKRKLNSEHPVMSTIAKESLTMDPAQVLRDPRLQRSTTSNMASAASVRSSILNPASVQISQPAKKMKASSTITMPIQDDVRQVTSESKHRLPQDFPRRRGS